MKNLLFILSVCLLASCSTYSYIDSPLVVEGVQKDDGHVIVTVKGIDNHNKETFAQFRAAPGYQVGDTLEFSKR